MSLNKTLDRLFDEIRREAKRNPDFADRLDGVMRAHVSRREASEAEEDDEPARDAAAQAPEPPPPPAVTNGAPRSSELNPAGFIKREGEEALRALLAEHNLAALRALVVEHNLDPGGVTSPLTRDELADHVVAQARARAERDDKLFDY